MTKSPEAEAFQRLSARLAPLEFTEEEIRARVPLATKILEEKRRQNALLLAHSYQRAEVCALSDHIGDSYGLSALAQQSAAPLIVFASVYFMGETAKLLNPSNEVRVPRRAGCSLADGIAPADVDALRRAHPGAPVVCYINTSAAVKARCDITCTSANALDIMEAMPGDTVIFLPDALMAKNLQHRTKKRIIAGAATCVVHEQFSAKELAQVRKEHPDAKIFAHPECDTDVAERADFLGSTEAMLAAAKATPAKEVMLVTECGLAERARAEVPGKSFVGSCQLCPFMKEITLQDLHDCLARPKPRHIVEIPPATANPARAAVEAMMRFMKKKQQASCQK